MSDQEEKKENKSQNSDKKQVQLEDYLSDKQAGQYQLCNQQFQNDEVIVHAGVTDQNENIIFVFGKYLPNPSMKKEYNQFKRYFYFFLDELVDQKYYIFYFHTDLSSYSYIQTIYSVMKKLPEKYYNNLKSFYIVNPTFLVKSYNFFSLPSCLKNKVEYLKSLRNVYDLNFFKVSFYKKIQNYVKTFNNQDQKLQKSKSQDDDKKDKLFGLGLDDLELNDQQMPKIIIEFINYFKDSENHIKEPGIFRKAPREDDIKEMETQMLNKNYDFILNHEDPHVVATSLKRLLSHMPEPIIPYKQYDIIKQLPQIKDVQMKKKKVHEIVEQIPVINFRVLRHIIDLLRTVSRYSETNLMKMEALTKIFAPTLIRSKPIGDKYKEALEELLMNPTVVEVVQIIYQDYDDIFSSRTLDEHTSNQLFNNLLEDVHGQNNTKQVQDPFINGGNKYNYLVSRDSNLYIGDNTDIEIKNGQVTHQNKNQLNLQRNLNFIDEYSDNSEEEDNYEEIIQSFKNQKSAQFQIKAAENSNKFTQKDVNVNNDVQQNELISNTKKQEEENTQQSTQQKEEEKEQKEQEVEKEENEGRHQNEQAEEQVEEYIIRAKSNTIQINDLQELKALRALLN